MGISLIGISHHNTPLAVRELFAFPAERQQELMKEMIAERHRRRMRDYQYL